MNQSVIFGDQLFVEADNVRFVAQQQGVNINCYVSFATISGLCQSQMVNQHNAASMFEQCQFDLEDQAEELINQEAFTDTGDIEL
ncbi:DUF1488 family protein [Shewanella phaeophyticola]|uniref:DUF1488 domain-containing protein n=1 Tax=Shewanella phaeophyticola TaxID=2978345 RepID=A0ABT2P6J1_9GAMM|nr:DUF1488 domain-containing protein [Shewanella sp. KJ10-1]MCT8988239.1 DUF1488 domain-containing protein [Shewanella sp. KJ10-1]MCU7375027.1 DUF1488 domain-containing protein [Paucibacter sp. O1-1]MDA3830029.1 DUF1488 domain-containing protein [Paucibacter sp. O1-1]